MKKRIPLLLAALVLALVILVAFLLFVIDNDEKEENGDGGQAEITIAADDVAVLVIDVFATREAEINAEIGDEENCLATPDGQSHVTIQGAGHVTIQGAGQVTIQGAGQVTIQGAGIPEAHGDIVYAEIGDLFLQRGGTLAAQTTGTAQFPNAAAELSQAIRKVEQWKLPEGNVLLVGVDTEGYTTSVIAQRIPDTISLLQAEFGINRFVVNMSFAVVPCGVFDGSLIDYQAILADYQDALAGEEFQELRETFEELVGGLGELPADQQDEGLALIINQPEFAPVRAALLRQERDRVTTIYRGQNTEVIQEQLAGCYDLFGGSGFGEAPTEQPTEAPTETGEQAGQLQEGTCTDPVFPSDPMFAWAIQVQTEAVVTNRGPRIINIASAGNLGLGFAFAPGYYPTVVSVSADYSNSGNATVDALVADGTIVSNDGEVQFNGLYERNGTIYPGTSYAAPRLSVEASVYLLDDGLIVCRGNTDDSTPPLAHPAFDNLPRVDASDQFCADFNTLVDN